MLRLPLLLAVCAAAALAACSTPTRILSSWRAPDIPARPYRQVLVAAITANPEARGVVEQALVAELRDADVAALASIDVLPPTAAGTRPDSAVIARVISERGIDGVLILSLLDVVRTEQVTEGEQYYQPRKEYDHLYGYWTTTYELVSTPESVKTLADVYIESNFYAIPGARLVWAGKSKTVSARSVTDVARSLAGSVVDALEDGVLVTP